MSKPLSDGAQRLVFGVLIVALVSFGIYWSLGGGSDTSDPEQQEQVAEGGRTETLEEGGEDQPVEPLPTVAAEDMALADWLPFSEEEFIAAAAVAQEFATDYGTIDYSKSPRSITTGSASTPPRSMPGLSRRALVLKRCGENALNRRRPPLGGRSSSRSAASTMSRSSSSSKCSPLRKAMTVKPRISETSPSPWSKKAGAGGSTTSNRLMQATWEAGDAPAVRPRTSV